MKNIKRFASLLLACVLCLSMSAVAFAAETEMENVPNVTVNDVDAGRSAGNVILSQTASLSLSNTSFLVNLTSGNWSADFTVAVFGKADTNYTVTMRQGSKTYNLGTVKGNGIGTPLFTLSYAPAGLYEFNVVSSSSTTDNYTAMVTIYD